jgi:uncharacterized protein CbrC (UPF0167 family)
MNQEPSVHYAQDIVAFLGDLGRQDVAPKTVQAYTADLVGFARWFADATGEPLSEVSGVVQLSPASVA